MLSYAKAREAISLYCDWISDEFPWRYKIASQALSNLNFEGICILDELYTTSKMLEYRERSDAWFLENTTITREVFIRQNEEKFDRLKKHLDELSAPEKKYRSLCAMYEEVLRQQNICKKLYTSLFDEEANNFKNV